MRVYTLLELVGIDSLVELAAAAAIAVRVGSGQAATAAIARHGLPKTQRNAEKCVGVPGRRE